MSEKVDQPWDAVVVGGGVAGLSAALTLGRARRRVLVIDAGEPRNRFAAHMHGALGHESLDPAELLRRGRSEVGLYDVTLRHGSVEGVEEADRGLVVILADGEQLPTRTLVVASGLTDELPAIPGLAEHWGTGVLHCPYCHGWEVRDQRLAVLGVAPMSLHQVELIRQWSDQLTFFTAGCGPLDPDFSARLRSRGVRLIDEPVTEVISEGDRLIGVLLADGTHVELDAVFVAPMPRPHDEFLSDLGLARTEYPMGSFISVDSVGATSHRRVWAMGNVVSPPANVPTCIGAGSMTGGAVNMALVTEDFDHAVTVEREAAEYWESEYADNPRRWSGRVNPAMAGVARTLSVGDALDLGCGEGGDAVWLAEQGWYVTAVDISATATNRGAEGAASKAVGDRITWISHDLATWTTDQTFDLVTASFFHSRVELPRTQILRRAARLLRPGGHLLIVSHVFETEEDIPPWSRRWLAEQDDHDHLDHMLLTPAGEIAELALDESEWDVVTQTIRSREAASPDGSERATIKDGVLLIRRRSLSEIG